MNYFDIFRPICDQCFCFRGQEGEGEDFSDLSEATSLVCLGEVPVNSNTFVQISKWKLSQRQRFSKKKTNHLLEHFILYVCPEVSAEEKSAFLWDRGEKVPVITVQKERGEGQMKSGKVSDNEPRRNDAAGTELQVPNSSMRSGKTARERLSERKMKSSIANAVRQQGGGQTEKEPEATNTDIMASMANSLAGFASFKFTTGTADSEEEVHNAWGEDDTEDNLLDRVHDLEQARGIALGPARSAARMRRARKNKRDKPGETAERSSPRPIEGSNADTLTAASSMMTNMFNSFATSVSFNVTQAKPSASGIDATELSAASTSEMPKASMAVPMLQPQSAGRERFAARKGLQKQSAAPAAEARPEREPEATNTDIMASMANSLAGFASFKFTTGTADSEEEVHNAWGEDDTEDNLLDRVHDLEQARGIALGPARSAARMRRARKNKRDKPGETAERSSPRPIEGSNADTLTAASSMMTNMFNSFATSVSFNVTQAKPSASGIDATELSAASTSEMPKASMAVPMLQPQSAGRERFRRRKDRLDPASSTCSKDRQSLTASQGTESHVSSQSQLQGLLDTTSPARQRLARRNPNAFTVTVKQEETFNSQNRSTFLAAAASSLAEFQKLFQTTSEEGEIYSIWGPDDTPEQYEQRLNALERARREPASSALHDRLMRRRQKRQEQNKQQDGRSVRSFLNSLVPFGD